MALWPCLFGICRLSKTKKKKYTVYDRLYGNGPYGGILTKKEPIRTLGFTLPYNEYGLLNRGEDIGQELFCVFMDRHGVEVHKRAKARRI